MTTQEQLDLLLVFLKEAEVHEERMRINYMLAKASAQRLREEIISVQQAAK